MGDVSRSHVICRCWQFSRGSCPFQVSVFYPTRISWPPPYLIYEGGNNFFRTLIREKATICGPQTAVFIDSRRSFGREKTRALCAGIAERNPDFAKILKNGNLSKVWGFFGRITDPKIRLVSTDFPPKFRARKTPLLLRGIFWTKN